MLTLTGASATRREKYAEQTSATSEAAIIEGTIPKSPISRKIATVATQPNTAL